MSPAREIALVVERELGRNLRSAKGIVLAILCILGGTGTTLVLLAGQKAIHYHTEHAERQAAYTRAFGEAIGKSLADAPEVLFGILMTTIALAPFLTALLGFDSVASDLQHRSVRYWTVRSRRSSYFFGKFLGIFLTASLMTLVMHVCIIVAIAVKSEIPLGTTVSWALRFWLTTLPISVAWSGMAACLSSLFRQPILALLLSFVGWLVFWLIYIITRVNDASKDLDVSSWPTWLYPGGYDRLLLSPNPDKLLAGVGASFAFAAVFMTIATLVFMRRDV